MFKLSCLRKDKLQDILNRYNLKFLSNVGNTTISQETKKYTMPIESKFTYEDMVGTTHTVHIHLVDYVKGERLPERSNLCCFYDHYPFVTKPIGIPIEYVPHKKNHSYRTQINTRRVKILKPVYEYKESDKNKIIEGNVYYTFGVFCSFECALAFIEDNKHSKKYSELFLDSVTLLHNMKFDMTGRKEKIIKALDYMLLDKYDQRGMSINEWRNNKKLEILDTGQIIKNVSQIPVGKLMTVNMRF